MCQRQQEVCLQNLCRNNTSSRLFYLFYSMYDSRVACLMLGCAFFDVIHDIKKSQSEINHYLHRYTYILFKSMYVCILIQKTLLLHHIHMLRQALAL